MSLSLGATALQAVLGVGNRGKDNANPWQSRTIQKVINSMQANPVRRGLVELPTDEQSSSALAHEDATDVPLRVDPVDLS